MNRKQFLKAALLTIALGTAAASHPTAALASGSDGGCDISSCDGSDCYEGNFPDQCCNANDDCCSFPKGVIDPNSCVFSVTGTGTGGGTGGSLQCPDLSCCCDPGDSNSCRCGESSCAAPQILCCADKDGRGVCPNGMSITVNICHLPKIWVGGTCTCPPGQIDSSGGGCECAPGKKLVGGDCVPDCDTNAYQTCCPNPCTPCGDGTTPQCGATSGTGNNLFESSGLCSPCECEACPTPPDTSPQICPATPAN